MSKKSRSKKHQQTIDVGYWIAVTLPADIAPLRSYVGQVQAVDEQGSRLVRLVADGDGPAYDLFIPWVNLDSALVATPDHDERLFAQEAAKWQEAMRGPARDHVEGTGEDTQTDTSVSG